jgi:SAM-dependent methyltransferase
MRPGRRSPALRFSHASTVCHTRGVPANICRVRRLAILLVAALAAGAWLAALWFRERRAHTVFPASQAASLLHPARRHLQSPERMVAAFDIAAGHLVLELGPGPGYFTTEAARAVGEHGRVVGADLQPDMIRELRARLPANVAPRVRTIVCDAMRLPLRSASFDRAFLVAVLGEVPEPEPALAELRRVLRPGGVLSIAETLTDPDYVRDATLRALALDAGLEFVDRRRQPLGYIMRFRRPS